MFGFSIRNAFRRKGIAVIAILGTALGVALMTVLLSISDGMDRQMSETMNELAGGIAVYPQDAPYGFFMGGGTPMPYSYVEDIEGIEHVKTVSPSVFAFIPTAAADFGDAIGVTLMGVELERDAEIGGATVHIVEGRSIEAENEIIVGSINYHYAKQSGLEAANIGSTFSVPTSGGPVELEVVGVSETGNMYFDMYLYAVIDTAREMAGLSTDEVDYIMVEAESSEYVEAVATAIEEMFEDSEVPVTAMVATEILGEISEAMGMFHGFLWVISLVAAIAGGVSIFIVMLISVIERTREFGILKASGWSNRNIIGSVVVQSITIALLGAMAGLAIGYGVGWGIDSYLAAEIAIVTGRLIAIVGGFGIIVGLVGGLYPALRAARVSPIESLRAI